MDKVYSSNTDQGTLNIYLMNSLRYIIINIGKL